MDMINTNNKNTNKYNNIIIPVFSCVILIIVLQKCPITFGFTCNKYTAKHEQAIQLMNLLLKSNLVNANIRVRLANITIGLTYV